MQIILARNLSGFFPRNPSKIILKFIRDFLLKFNLGFLLELARVQFSLKLLKELLETCPQEFIIKKSSFNGLVLNSALSRSCCRNSFFLKDLSKACKKPLKNLHEYFCANVFENFSKVSF